MSKYAEQAENFLKVNNLQFRATQTAANACPPWDDERHIHGDEYQITISRKGVSGRLSFRFWNSLNDVQNGNEPNAYDVLSCVSSEAYTPETFRDFCAEYGYDEDSRKAEKTFKRADRFAHRIRAFFSEKELEAVSEIR